MELIFNDDCCEELSKEGAVFLEIEGDKYVAYCSKCYAEKIKEERKEELLKSLGEKQ